MKRHKIPEKYIISYKNKYGRRCDIFIIVLAIINSVSIPLEIAFKFDSLTYDIFDNAIDIMFLVDIIRMFFTSYHNKEGKEVFDSYKIAVNYCFTVRFLVDVLALLQFFTFMYSRFAIFGFFKLIRVRRLGTFINRLNLTKDMKAYLNFLKLSFYLSVWLHIHACVWYMVVSKNGEFDYEEVKQIKLLNKHELDPKDFQLYTGEHGSKILFQADLNNYQIPDEYEVYKPWYAPLDWINYVD